MAGIAQMNTLQLGMLAMAVAGLTILLLSTRRKLRGRTPRPRNSVRREYEALGRATGTRQGIEDVMLELDRLSREIHARIDTKCAKLEAILRDADARIERLSRLAGADRTMPSCDVTLDAQLPDTPSGGEATSPQDDAQDGAQDSVRQLADQGLSPAVIAEKTGTPTGEVELILALERARKEATRDRRAATSAQAPS